MVIIVVIITNIHLDSKEKVLNKIIKFRLTIKYTSNVHDGEVVYKWIATFTSASDWSKLEHGSRLIGATTCIPDQIM